MGPGDDGAVLALAGPLVTSVDVLVQDVHFKLGWSDPADIGRKAVAVNVADLEAMGARATAVVLGFSAPPQLQLRWVPRARGRAAGGVRRRRGEPGRRRRHPVPRPHLSVTVLGGLEGRSPVLRSGARPGDVVALRGRTGWAAAGLAVLRRASAHRGRWSRPSGCPRCRTARAPWPPPPGATAMIDVSDGLLGDLGHVALASGGRGRPAAATPSRCPSRCRRWRPPPASTPTTCC